MICERVAAALGVPCLSFRDAAQAATRAGSQLGVAMRRFMDAEQPVPPELVAALIVRRLREPDAAGGFAWASARAGTVAQLDNSRSTSISPKPDPAG